MKKEQIIYISLLLIGTSLLRFIPHPPNMTPIIAIGILSVTCFQSRLFQFGFPLFIMIITDAIIGFHTLIPVVYLSIIVASLSGFILKHKYSIINGLGCSLLSSILFFTISNFGVWAIGNLYPKTLTGLIHCYIAAIPFFHNTVISTSVIIIAILSTTKLLERNLTKLPNTNT